MLKGAVLGSVIGAILSLYRRKSVWLGVLAGGLAGGYLTREGIINVSKENNEWIYYSRQNQRHWHWWLR